MEFSEEEIDQRLPDPERRRVMYIHLKVPRTGRDKFRFAFRDIIARCLAEFDILSEEIRDNLAVLNGEAINLYLQPDRDSSQILVFVDRKCDRQLATVRARLTNIVAKLNADFEKIEATLLLESSSYTVCPAKLVQEARECREPHVTTWENEENVPTVQFRMFYDIIEDQFDVYLAHDWGVSPVFSTHQMVSELIPLLEARGFRVWFDEFDMVDYDATSIMNGLEKSKKVCVFLTKRYVERAMNSDTNVAKEFHYAVKERIRNIIPVHFEPNLKLLGTIVEYHLGHIPWIDFSSEATRLENLNQLCDEIRKN